ncbi:1416_t:CDS:2 [Funneliformis caledonium]|uniref:1416_t:CDS:1 n=2 Tax=Funneliformis TaxID=1117308 RepID=A0A9N9DJX8_9GLOM|nr:1416_t:CDS:2 [Funneliformis caledonium]
MLDTLYISQRAANAIIADVAPYRISSEALLAINNLLDEFLYFLVDSARSLDLVKIKLAIGQVLPTSLGKNAVQEAELELKTYVESGNSDHTKEKTIEITPFPLQKVFEQFRLRCQFFSTLGERGADDRDRDTVPDLYSSEGIHIAPSLAIYLTAVLEYVGEYILILVAKASEKQGVEVARAQEVYSALSEDLQIFPLFRRTNLKEQMESDSTQPITSTATNDFIINGSTHVTSSQLSTFTTSDPSTKPPITGHIQSKPGSNNGHMRGGKQVSLDGFDKDVKKSPTSPVKSLSDYGRQSSDYKNMRSSKSMQSLQGQGGDKESDLRSVSSMEDSIEKMRSFETLISNNQTMKVSLTPNRLITIETHKRPPKLAPREPNTSPDDPNGKLKKKDSKADLPKKLGKIIDKLEPVSERPKTPGSPGSNSRHTPLISPSYSSYYSDRINATINKTLSSSLASDDQNQSFTSSPTTSSSYLSPSLHYSKSFDQTQSYYNNAPSKHKSRTDPSDLLDDELYTEGQKVPKRRHQAQDLIDFLSTSPPKETISFNNNSNDSLGNSGKKKEKKLKKLFSRLKKASFIDESTPNLNDQRSSNASINSFYTHRSNSGSTLVNKPARYVKIEIPKIPPKEDNQEQSIFDQVEIQGRHARQVSRASLSGSSRNLQYTPNRSTFSSTGGMTSPTILEKESSNSKLNSDDYKNECLGTTDRSKQFQKSSNILNIQPMNTSVSQSGTNNNILTSPAHKIPSPITPKQKSYNNNVNSQISSQEINKVKPDLSKEQNTHFSAEILSINNENIINENEVRTKSEAVEILKESVKHKEALSYDSFLASIIETEISIQEVQEETTFDTCNEEELEEALIVEWLLGTGLTFKSTMTYIDVMQVYEVREMEESDYEDVDTKFIDGGNKEEQIANKVVQVGHEG